jgi:hypothetical protein
MANLELSNIFNFVWVNFVFEALNLDVAFQANSFPVDPVDLLTLLT